MSEHATRFTCLKSVTFHRDHRGQELQPPVNQLLGSKSRNPLNRTGFMASRRCLAASQAHRLLLLGRARQLHHVPGRPGHAGLAAPLEGGELHGEMPGHEGQWHGSGRAGAPGQRHRRRSAPGLARQPGRHGRRLRPTQHASGRRGVGYSARSVGSQHCGRRQGEAAAVQATLLGLRQRHVPLGGVFPWPKSQAT